MTRDRIPGLLVFAGLILPTSAICGAECGNLSGRLVVDGTVPEPAPIALPTGINVLDESVVVGKDNTLQNVFVYLRTKDVHVAPRYASSAKDELVLDIKNGRFDPHMLVLRSSQTLKVTNSDRFGINAKLNPLKNPAWNHLLPAGTSATLQLALQENLPVRADSNIQPWLRAWVLVRDDPYSTVSLSDGTFTVRELPAGLELEFQLWQERAGYLRAVPFRGGASDGRGRFKITLEAGDNDMGDLRVPASLLR